MFKSEFAERAFVALPSFEGIRIQMMPVIMGDLESLPPMLQNWRPAVSALFSLSETHKGTGYLTIDQRCVEAGQTHRRPGLHVDGVGAWGRGTWGATGMLVVSNLAACAAWNQEFDGEPLSGETNDELEGNCEHLRAQCRDENRAILKSSMVYWLSPFCVHESLPLARAAARTFVRLSMPSDRPWPANCTRNPLDIQPGGPIAAPRKIGGVFSYES